MVSDECHHYGTHSTMSHCDKVIVPDRQRGHLQYTLQVGFFHQRSFPILPVISGTERKIKDQTQAMARRKVRGSLRAGNPGQELSNGKTSVGQSTWAITALDSGKKGHRPDQQVQRLARSLQQLLLRRDGHAVGPLQILCTIDGTDAEETADKPSKKKKGVIESPAVRWVSLLGLPRQSATTWVT